MIRPAEEKDLSAILDVHRRAFGEEDEAELVCALLGDPTAAPILSLVAEHENEIVGHILFTNVNIKDTPLNARLLAPLAVEPDYHFKGWGKRLIAYGLQTLSESDVDMVFVLGDPQYYTRAGFSLNATREGFPAPHKLPAAYEDAWMWIKLHDCLERGPVQVADAIAPYEYWSD